MSASSPPELSKSKRCATRNLLKTKRQHDSQPIVNWWNELNFGESGDSGDSDEVSAELELAFVDFQRFDSVVESRWWNSKLSCRP
jgi:hypothetical protein